MMTRTDLLEIEMLCATLRSAADRLQRAAKLVAASTAVATAEAALARLAPPPSAPPNVVELAPVVARPRVEVARPARSRVTRVETVERGPRGVAVFDADDVAGRYRGHGCEVDFSVLR